MRNGCQPLDSRRRGWGRLFRRWGCAPGLCVPCREVTFRLLPLLLEGPGLHPALLFFYTSKRRTPPAGLARSITETRAQHAQHAPDSPGRHQRGFWAGGQGCPRACTAGGALRELDARSRRRGLQAPPLCILWTAFARWRAEGAAPSAPASPSHACGAGALSARWGGPDPQRTA